MAADSGQTKQQKPLQALQQNLQQFLDTLPRPQLSWSKPKAAETQVEPKAELAVNRQHQRAQSSPHSHATQHRIAPTVQREPQGTAESLDGLPVSREDLGRATWTFLHTLAAQYPEKPTRSQQRDVKALVDVFTRLYPCRECAEHFGEIVRSKPPTAQSSEDLQQWMCTVHNAVNRTLDKPVFNCRFASQRWGALDCDDQMACSLSLGHSKH